MRSSKLRRWKESADDAISQAHFERERHTLRREIRARAFARTRAAAGMDLRIGSLLSDFVVRLSLASRHVAVLQEGARSAEYEDAAALAQQSTWTKRYLEEQLQCPLLVAAEDELPVLGLDALHPLYNMLTRLLDAQMGEADEAAA